MNIKQFKHQQKKKTYFEKCQQHARKMHDKILNDQYNGGYTVLLNGDVTLTDGTTFKKGTNVTKYTTQVIDQDNGKVTIEFDKGFLTRVDFTKSDFCNSLFRIKRGGSKVTGYRLKGVLNV